MHTFVGCSIWIKFDKHLHFPKWKIKFDIQHDLIPVSKFQTFKVSSSTWTDIWFCKAKLLRTRIFLVHHTLYTGSWYYRIHTLTLIASIHTSQWMYMKWLAVRGGVTTMTQYWSCARACACDVTVAATLLEGRRDVTHCTRTEL